MIKKTISLSVLISACLVLMITYSSCDTYSLATFFCDDSEVTESKARELGRARLEDFCKSKGIDPDEFITPEISSTTDIPWILDYSTKRDGYKSFYFFRVMIDKCGKIEKSWQYYP